MNKFHLDLAKTGSALLLTVNGRVDESADFAAVTWDGVTRVTVVLADVAIFTSFGVKRWVEFVRQIPESVAVTLARCSFAVVHQLNALPNFIDAKNAVIESFYVPYYCVICDTGQARLLLSADLPRGLDSLELEPISCEKCGNGLDLDATLPRYLAFLHRSTRAIAG